MDFPVKKKELKYYGYHACLKLWQTRPQDVVRVYVEQRNVKDLGPLLKWCASKGKAYHIISADEMAKVSGSVHHEGLCILAKELEKLDFLEIFKELSGGDPALILYLDGVQNPHNLGSIMRVCAHFGVKYIVGTNLPAISPSSYRIAQGGAEWVKMISLEHLKPFFKKMEQSGFVLVATSSHKGRSLYDYTFPPRTLLVMGSESEGVNRYVQQAAKESLLIPGTGVVESLNVSVATGLFLGEYWRQQC